MKQYVCWQIAASLSIKNAVKLPIILIYSLPFSPTGLNSMVKEILICSLKTLLISLSSFPNYKRATPKVIALKTPLNYSIKTV